MNLKDIKENKQIFNMIVAIAAIIVIIIGLKVVKSFLPTSNTTGKMDKDSVSIALIGNVNLSGKLYNRYKDMGISGFLSDNISNKIKNSDIAIMNQAFTVSSFDTPNNAVSDNYHIFNELGINMVSMANGYIQQNASYIGNTTVASLDSMEVKHAGLGEDRDSASKVSTIECNGMKIGLLSVYYNDPNIKGSAVNGTSHEKAKQGIYIDNSTENITYNIKRAKKACDYLILSIAWGNESDTKPDKNQRAIAKDFIDAGADIIIGCNNFIQGIQYYKDKPIIYSIGNFLNTDYHANTEMFELIVHPDKKIDLSVNGCSTEAYNTRAYEGTKKEQFINSLTKLSFDVNIDSNGKITNKTKE